MLRVLMLALALGVSVVVGTAGSVLATGQPNQSCEEQTTRPGHAQDAPGSAFNPDGMAGTKYAGEQPQNSRNTASSSQYDVACANQPK